MTVLSPQALQSGVCLLVDFPELGGPLFFTSPVKQLVARHPDEVRTVLDAAQNAASSGYWVGGYLAYEAAAAFGWPVFSSPDLPSSWPLAWFALFDAPRKVAYPPLDSLALLLPDWPRPTVAFDRYRQDLAVIAEQIASGESYQVNYTLDARLDAPVDPAGLFLQLQGAHRFPRAMWLWDDALGAVASWSPESFLERRGVELTTAPIKGTRPRGDDPERDRVLGAALEGSEKDQAEHVMIVDMARNDLGRICQDGSVRVAPFMARRAFSTVFHLESRVHGRLRPGVGLVEIMEALFPAASITGAPKQRTMEIIRALEARPRGIYTGCMGVLRPGGDFLFNVAIRTLVWSPVWGGRMGLGGGVVADSDPVKEWEEMEDKGRFLTRMPDALGLIETFRIGEEGVNLEPHWRRLAASAEALGFVWERQQAETVARDGMAALQGGLLPQVGRLLLGMNGVVTFSHRPWQPWPGDFKVRVARWRSDPLDHLVRHKTTRRAHLDAERAAACQAGYDEVLFVSVLGQVTEGSMTAVLVRLHGCWYAPFVEDGLLPSLWREAEMARLGAVLRSMTLEDLAQAEEMVMGNAVRGGIVVARLDDAQGRAIYKLGGLFL